VTNVEPIKKKISYTERRKQVVREQVRESNATDQTTYSDIAKAVREQLASEKYTTKHMLTDMEALLVDNVRSEVSRVSCEKRKTSSSGELFPEDFPNATVKLDRDHFMKMRNAKAKHLVDLDVRIEANRRRASASADRWREQFAELMFGAGDMATKPKRTVAEALKYIAWQNQKGNGDKV